MDKDTTIGRRPGGAERPHEPGAAAPGRGGRMSRQRKTAAVLRLLRGEDLEQVSRSLGVTAATLIGWRDAFLAAGEAALTTKPATGEDLESDRLKASSGRRCSSATCSRRRSPSWRPIAPFGPPEAQAMSRAVSPVSGKPYGLAAVCRVWRLARSGIYRHLSSPPSHPHQRGGADHPARCPTMR